MGAISDELERQIRQSWVANAAAWTDAVREGRIPSRKAGTDAAIRGAIAKFPPCKILDVGCGEGWLAREVGSPGYEVTGIDSSEPLIATAREGGGGEFFQFPYGDLISSPDRFAGPFGLIVANFSLLGEPLVPLLRVLRERLDRDGALLIQTPHPGNEVSGWRTETFARMGPEFVSTMPYYFRTFEDWSEALRAAGFTITGCLEPLSPATQQPLSLLLEARPSANL